MSESHIPHDRSERPHKKHQQHNPHKKQQQQGQQKQQQHHEGQHQGKNHPDHKHNQQQRHQQKETFGERRDEHPNTQHGQNKHRPHEQRDQRHERPREYRENPQHREHHNQRHEPSIHGKNQEHHPQENRGQKPPQQQKHHNKSHQHGQQQRPTQKHGQQQQRHKSLAREEQDTFADTTTTQPKNIAGTGGREQSWNKAEPGDVQNSAATITPDFIPPEPVFEAFNPIPELGLINTPNAPDVQDQEPESKKNTLPEIVFPPATSPGTTGLPPLDRPLYPGARGAAIRVLSRVEQSDSYLDKVLESELAGSDLNALDRALLTELVHGVLRWQSRLDWILTGFYHGEFVKCITPVKNAMRIALYQVMFLSKIPPFAAVNESVEIIKRLKGARSANLVNAVLRNILHNIANIRYPQREEDVHRYFSVMYAHPYWMVKRWAKRYGDEMTEALLKANNERPKVVLRLNPMLAQRTALLEFFDTQEIKHWDTPYHENLIMVGSLSSVREWDAYQQGWFSVQDVSAAMVAELAAPKPGALVYDLCAAPGGKTTYCAELMHNEGKIIAVDKYPGKLLLIQENLERLKLTCIETLVADARTFKPKELADVVLVDAPCSGLGTLAKKPDIRWKTQTETIPPLARLQREILINAAKLVKPGGTLVYSTCTIEPEENVEQAEWFLREFPDFQVEDAVQFLPEQVCSDGYMQTFPHQHQMDGAFAVRFVKK